MFAWIFGQILEELGIVYFVDIYENIDAIEEGTREFLAVILDLVFGTGALMGGVAQIATGAGIHGGDQHEVGRVGGFLVGARDGDGLVL